MTIRIDLKTNQIKEYKRIIVQAKTDNVFKACGNPDDPWIILKFEEKEQLLVWLDDVK